MFAMPGWLPSYIVAETIVRRLAGTEFGFASITSWTNSPSAFPSIRSIATTA
jgi:hypothetical protein